MLLLISPSKTLDFTEANYKNATLPRLLEDTNSLIHYLRQKSVEDLAKLMKLSDKLANLNVLRYQQFRSTYDKDNAKPAILTFTGDVYRGLDVASFNQEDLAYAQNCIRILSGLYGLLRPMDMMQAYRLEMGTKLQTERGKNLYEYWKDKITDLLNQDIVDGKHDLVVNVASNEYMKVINKQKLNKDVLNIVFKEEKNGDYKVIAVYAKVARGQFCNFVVKSRMSQKEDLKGFDYDGYTYNESLSTKKSFVFTR